jgi:single-stranded DNA-binding protein
VSGRKEQEPSFFTVIVWRDQAKHAAESLAKGSRVVVVGRLQQRSWAAEDGNALAVEVNLFRHTYNTLRPHQASTNAHHVRLTSPSNTAVSVWPLADRLLDWEVLT